MVKLAIFLYEFSLIPSSYHGEPSSEFTASNGLRQGDPLAPCIFVLSLQGFTSILEYEVKRSNIIPISASKNLAISHLFFADDIMFFLRASKENAINLKSLLAKFELISGLKLNTAKSKLYFSKKADSELITHILDIQPCTLPVRYLGLPLFQGRLSKKDCAPLLDKIQIRLDSWKAKSLSMAGHVELVISTLSNLYSFWLAVCPIPCSVINVIETVCCNFIWGDHQRTNGIHAISWKDVCLPKEEGGLGIKRISDCIKAGLTKNLWNIVQGKDSLWVKWIHERYLKKDSIWSVSYKPHYSWMLKRIILHRPSDSLGLF